MPKKTLIIFISVFLIVGAIVITLSILSNKESQSETPDTPWYQKFNPFGTGFINNQNNNNNQNPGDVPFDQTGGTTKISRFYQITDFPVSGGVYVTEKKPIQSSATQEEKKVIIDSTTKVGRQEIQKILNGTLTLKTPLVTDGNFGKLTIEAIKEFQKLKGVSITGKIDQETAPFFTKTDGTSNIVQYEFVPTVRYVERQNGHLHKIYLDTLTTEKISNSTIPSIYEAFLNNTGESVIYRYLSGDKSITTFLATLGSPKGEFLVENITDMSVSPEKTKFFYLVENTNGVNGIIGTFGAAGREVVFSSPFTEWLSQWTNNQKIYLTSKASYVTKGSVFLLNTTTKTISKIFGNVVGLTTLVNPGGTFVLYSESTSSGPRLQVFNVTNHTIKELDLYGLPEKCIWSKDNINVYCGVPNNIIGNQYPDIWYQGLVSFDDFFVKINTLTGERTTIANSIDETPIDATKLFLDEKEENLFFINKKDLTLWSLNIK